MLVSGERLTKVTDIYTSTQKNWNVHSWNITHLIVLL